MAAGGPTAVSPWTYTVSIAMTAAGAFVVHAFLLHPLWAQNKVTVSGEPVEGPLVSGFPADTQCTDTSVLTLSIYARFR
jgi:hypothetical protein